MDAGSALRSQSRDSRRHTAYVISTTGGIRRTSQATTVKPRDGGKSVPLTRRELERLINPDNGAAGLRWRLALTGLSADPRSE